MRRLLIISSVLLACPSPRSRTPFIVRVAVTGSLEKVDPVPGSPSFSSWAQNWVFEPLARFDARGEFVPAFASRVEMRQRGQIYIELPRERRFNDGSLISVEDVEQ